MAVPFPWEDLPGRVRAADTCELCEEARLTEWFHEDDDCWIAECEACFVPMVVWRNHDAAPSEETKRMLGERLLTVVAELFEGQVYLDDNLRSIPDHYHIHARSRTGPMGRGLRRR